jgi:hypothetical protein
MKRLGKNAGLMRTEAFVLQRYRGKAGDEHDLDPRLPRRDPPRHSMPSMPGITTSASNRS